MLSLDVSFGFKVQELNGSIMLSRAHNMCKSGLDPIDCKSSWLIVGKGKFNKLGSRSQLREAKLEEPWLGKRDFTSEL